MKEKSINQIRLEKREYAKTWREKNHERAIMINRKSKIKNRENNIKCVKVWREKNKDKILEYRRKNKFKNAVQCYTNYHFKDMKIKCNICSSKENLQFHHFVYRIPVEKEDFTILCRECHDKLRRVF